MMQVLIRCLIGFIPIDFNIGAQEETMPNVGDPFVYMPYRGTVTNVYPATQTFDAHMTEVWDGTEFFAMPTAVDFFAMPTAVD
jgi:hypothetical protein